MSLMSHRITTFSVRRPHLRLPGGMQIRRQLHIQVHIRVQLRSQLLVTQPIPPKRNPRRTPADRLEVPQVRVHIQPLGATITLHIRVPRAILHLIQTHHRVTSLINPVLRTRMPVIQRNRRQPRDGVVGVRDTVLGAGLVGDEGDEGVVADARGPVRVEIGRVAGLAEVGRREGRHGAAERVACHDDLVGRVGGRGGADGG